LTVLAIKELTAGYGQLAVLHGVSMHVGKGEAVAIVGANGAGKTTLVNAICGLGPVTQGRVIKDEVDLTSDAAHRRARHGIAVVLESRRLFGENDRAGEFAPGRGARVSSPFRQSAIHMAANLRIVPADRGAETDAR
jgi:ABC-type branched-subunit amino acid transport system ATPase component